ncbi:hypothetical protein BJV77DRAFT_703208 [Russula vinacea]|nr:hypothetical protein BJV77DRAFT_703208 [Russula vinacea]
MGSYSASQVRQPGRNACSQHQFLHLCEKQTWDTTILWHSVGCTVSDTEWWQALTCVWVGYGIAAPFMWLISVLSRSFMSCSSVVTRASSGQLVVCLYQGQWHGSPWTLVWCPGQYWRRVHEGIITVDTAEHGCASNIRQLCEYEKCNVHCDGLMGFSQRTRCPTSLTETVCVSFSGSSPSAIRFPIHQINY